MAGRHAGPLPAEKVVQCENAQIGVLITMSEPTKPMRTEAAGAGFYHSTYFNRDYPRLQIRTVAELLDGKGIDYPAIAGGNITFKRAQRVKEKRPETSSRLQKSSQG
jgi:site-specific DNA-methyltransferase (adenine-specific)